MGLRTLLAAWRGYFYQPGRQMIWHPIYEDKTLTTAERRAIREEQLPSEWTWRVINDSRAFWGDCCAACGSREELQHDHLIPVAHLYCPGAVPSNLLLLCRVCNEDKSWLDFAIWYQESFHKDPTPLIYRIHDWQNYCLGQGWN